MSFLGWVAVGGVLLLVMALSSARIRRLPISTSAIYLGLGVALGPIGLGWLEIDVIEEQPWLLRLTEVAVFVSLFIGGLRVGRPRAHPAWTAPLRLVGPMMLLCIAGVALVAHLVFGLDAATALLAGAVLAPTDPVLSGDVSVNDAADRDCVRYSLSGEAGLNDGAAMPFVLLAIGLAQHDGAGPWLWRWAAESLVWSVLAGLAVGYLLGMGVGRLAIKLRSVERNSDAATDFLALALIALSYAGAEAIHALGFLAVFAAGVGLRSAEQAVVARSPHPDVGAEDEHPPAEQLVGARPGADELREPAVAAGTVVAETLSFGDTAERLLEVLIVVLIGVSLSSHFDPRGLLLAAALFVVVRPVATQLALLGSDMHGLQRWLIAWFGIRGIGSLYYVAYAMGHGLRGPAVEEVANLTITTIAASVVVHGISATPLLRWYERALERREGGVSRPGYSIGQRSPQAQ